MMKNCLVKCSLFIVYIYCNWINCKVLCRWRALNTKDQQIFTVVLKRNGLGYFANHIFLCNFKYMQNKKIWKRLQPWLTSFILFIYLMIFFINMFRFINTNMFMFILVHIFSEVTLKTFKERIVNGLWSNDWRITSFINWIAVGMAYIILSSALFVCTYKKIWWKLTHTQ